MAPRLAVPHLLGQPGAGRRLTARRHPLPGEQPRRLGHLPRRDENQMGGGTRRRERLRHARHLHLRSLERERRGRTGGDRDGAPALRPGPPGRRRSASRRRLGQPQRVPAHPADRPSSRAAPALGSPRLRGLDRQRPNWRALRGDRPLHGRRDRPARRGRGRLALYKRAAGGGELRPCRRRLRRGNEVGRGGPHRCICRSSRSGDDAGRRAGRLGEPAGRRHRAGDRRDLGHGRHRLHSDPRRRGSPDHSARRRSERDGDRRRRPHGRLLRPRRSRQRQRRWQCQRGRQRAARDGDGADRPRPAAGDVRQLPEPARPGDDRGAGRRLPLRAGPLTGTSGGSPRRNDRPLRAAAGRGGGRQAGRPLGLRCLPGGRVRVPRDRARRRGERGHHHAAGQRVGDGADQPAEAADRAVGRVRRRRSGAAALRQAGQEMALPAQARRRLRPPSAGAPRPLRRAAPSTAGG